MNNNLLYTIYTNFFNIHNEMNNTMINSLSVTEYSDHLIGIYDMSLQIWYNAWGLHNYNNHKEIKLSRELFKYLLENDTYNKTNNINDSIIKSLIFNSKIYIQEKLQLNLIIGTFLFYTKIKIYKFISKNRLIYFYGVSNNKYV